MPLFYLGRLLLTREKYQDAIRHLLKTLTPESERTPVHMYTLAEAYARQGELQKARQYAQQAKQRVGPGQESVASAIETLLTKLDRMAKPDGQ